MQLLGTLKPKYHITPFKSVNQFMLTDAGACREHFGRKQISSHWQTKFTRSCNNNNNFSLLFHV